MTPIYNNLEVRIGDQEAYPKFKFNDMLHRMDKTINKMPEKLWE
jgi:hypothetical protein